MEYFLLLAAIGLFFLSYKNYATYNKLKYSGKIAVLISTRQNTNLYLVLGLFSLAVFVFVILQ